MHNHYFTAVLTVLTVTLAVSSPPQGSSTQRGSASPITLNEHSSRTVQADGFANRNTGPNFGDSANTQASIEKVTSADVGILIVPGIQGTLLYRCQGTKKSSKCFPIFLSPLKADAVDEVYEYVSDIKTGKTTALTHKLESADYPEITCAPQPYSHIGHCNRLPAYGPVRELRNHINSSFPSTTVVAVPYDWRLSLHELTSMQLDSSIVTTFTRMVDSIAKPKKVIIIAHGHGCRVIANILNQTSTEITQRKARIHALLCAAPSHPNQAARAMLEGSGVLLTGAAHADGDACTNVRERHGDFSVVHPLLGFSRRRLQNAPIAKGAWDASETWKLVSSNKKRARLANNLPSVRELATNNGSFPSIYDVRNVFCIDGQASENYTPGCRMIAHANEHVSLHASDASYMHISALVKDILDCLLR